MDFSYSPKTQELQAKVTRFMEDNVYPNEQRYWDELEANTKAGKRWTPLPLIEELFVQGALALQAAAGCDNEAAQKMFLAIDEMNQLALEHAEFLQYACGDAGGSGDKGRGDEQGFRPIVARAMRP